MKTRRSFIQIVIAAFAALPFLFRFKAKAGQQRFAPWMISQEEIIAEINRIQRRNDAMISARIVLFK